jgi:hypothetical protein
MFLEKPDAGEESKYFSTLYVKVFSKLAADEKSGKQVTSPLAWRFDTDKKPNADEKRGPSSLAPA